MWSTIEIAPKLIDVFSFLSYMRSSLMWLLLRWSLYKGRSLLDLPRLSKWTRSTRKLGILLTSLYRREVIAPSSTMIHKVTLSESLLEILTRFRLETSIVHIRIRTLALNDTRCSFLVLLAHDKIMIVYFTPFSWFHKLICLGSGILGSRCSTELILKVLEGILSRIRLILKHRFYCRRSCIILLRI